jgi:primosomal protein N'
VNEEKVKLSADHVKRELEKFAFPNLIIAGPAPAPLARAETKFRYQLMLRTKQMSKLSHRLADLNKNIALADDVAMMIDVDPVNLM